MWSFPALIKNAMIDDNTGMSRPTHLNVCSNIYSKTYYKMAEVLFVTFLTFPFYKSKYQPKFHQNSLWSISSTSLKRLYSKLSFPSFQGWSAPAAALEPHPDQAQSLGALSLLRRQHRHLLGKGQSNPDAGTF